MNESSLNINSVEDNRIEIENFPNKFAVGTIYCHPINLASEIEEIGNKLQETFHKLNLNQMLYYALGDYNIDLMQYSINKPVQKYVNTLLSR